MRLTPGTIPSDEFRDEVGRLGQELYDSRIRMIVEHDNRGRYIAIHVDSEDYRIAESTSQATRAIHEIHPVDGRLYIRRIGDEPEFGLAARILASDLVAAGRE